MARSLRTILLFLLMACAAACSSAPPMFDGPAHPPMWRVKGAQGEFLILAAIHALPPGIDWQRGHVLAASQSAEELWLELSPSETRSAPDVLASMMDDEPVPALGQRFDAATAESIADIGAATGLNDDDINQAESWAVAMMIEAAAQNDAGLSSEYGVETALIQRFAARDKPIRGLETARGQLGILDALPNAAQDRLVHQALGNRAQAAQRIRVLVRAWASGDTAMLARVAAEEMARNPDLREPLLLRRNRAWAQAVERRMTRPGTVMLAVGGAHLLGDGSLLALLRQRGFTVERVQ